MSLALSNVGLFEQRGEMGLARCRRPSRIGRHAPDEPGPPRDASDAAV